MVHSICPAAGLVRKRESYASRLGFAGWHPRWRWVRVWDAQPGVGVLC